MILHFEDEVVRAVNNVTPIIFTWPRTGVTPTVSVALDNVTFAALQGSVEEISTGTTGRYQINYSAEDRLSSPGIMTYKIEEGGDEAYLTIQILASTASTTVPDVVYSDYGPKRVKTQEMEIEQWDPRIIDEVSRRGSNELPTFGSSRFTIGIPGERTTENT